MELKKTMGDKLKAARQRNGISQKEIADILGVTQPTISEIESGASNMTLSTIENYCNAINMNCEIKITKPHKPKESQKKSVKKQQVCDKCKGTGWMNNVMPFKKNKLFTMRQTCSSCYGTGFI